MPPRASSRTIRYLPATTWPGSTGSAAGFPGILARLHGLRGDVRMPGRDDPGARWAMRFDEPARPPSPHADPLRGDLALDDDHADDLAALALPQRDPVLAGQ